MNIERIKSGKITTIGELIEKLKLLNPERGVGGFEYIEEKDDWHVVDYVEFETDASGNIFFEQLDGAHSYGPC